MTLPSKELISKVLEINCTFVDELHGNMIGFETDNRKYSINIFELTNKCKELALSEGFQLESAVNINGGYCRCYDVEGPFIEAYTAYNKNSEQDAIIEVCEQILKETK